MAKRVVLFVHGFMGAQVQFAHLLPVAEDAGYAVSLLTLPGHGGDVTAFAAANRFDWQAALEERLDELRKNYQSIVIAGHSMGGLLACKAYGKNPEKIRAILALALPLYIKATFSGLKIRLSTLLPARENEDCRVAAARRFCGVAGITAMNAIRLLPNTFELLFCMRETRSLLKTACPPVTLIHSVRDEIVSARSVRCFQRHVPRGRCVTLSQSSHFWYAEGEKRVIEAELKRLLISAGGEDARG